MLFVSLQPSKQRSGLIAVKKSFDSINHASDLDDFKRSSFDSIDHVTDMDEGKRNFDSIEHASDMSELKRGFDSIDHATDLDEGKRMSPSEPEIDADFEVLVHQLLAAQRPVKATTIWRALPKRTFDSIGHGSDLDYLTASKRPFDSIQHAPDMDEMGKRSSSAAALVEEFRRLQASGRRRQHQMQLLQPHHPKRNFDSIEHSTDMESFRKRSSSDKRPFDSIEHATDMADMKRRFDSIEHASDLTAFGLNGRKKRAV